MKLWYRLQIIIEADCCCEKCNLQMKYMLQEVLLHFEYQDRGEQNVIALLCIVQQPDRA